MIHSFFKAVVDLSSALNRKLSQNTLISCTFLSVRGSRCTKFFHPERSAGVLYRLCKADVCLCAEENCTYQKKKKVPEDRRMDYSCEDGMDYVYKVSVAGMHLGHDSDVYHLKVEQVLKEGTDEDVEGKIRPFLARSSCRDHLGLQQGKSYLVMGKVDLSRRGFGGSLQYMFGEETWVEYWPTREESQTPQYRDQFIGISDLQHKLLTEGCTT